MSEFIVDTFGIVQDFADLHGDMNTPLYRAIMDVMVSRQREEIVRCKDCEHRAGANVQAVVSDLCMWLNIIVKPDGFCAWGERREP